MPIASERSAVQNPFIRYAVEAGWTYIAPSAFEQFPHWQTSSHQEQEVRKAIYKALINAQVDGLIDVANGILKMLRRAGS